MQHKNPVFINYHQAVMWLLVIIIVLVGCSTSQSGGQMSESTPLEVGSAPTTIITSSATPSPSSMPVQTATTTPSPSDSPVPTSTSTPFPSATPTVKPTPLPTWTPLPTVAPQQRGQVYTELMSSNAGCVLPCWWGFQMGETTIDEIRQFYTSFDPFITEQVGHNGISVLTVKFEDPQIENGIQVRHTFIAQNSVVIEAEIEVIWDPNYQIETLLQQLGQPDEVWLRTIPDTYEGVLPMSLRLYFAERGVMVSYAVFAGRVNDIVQACFHDEGGAILLLWKPSLWDAEGSKGFIERANESSELTLEGHRPIAEISNWDVDQFYTILSDPAHSACLETPSNLWSSP